MFWRQGCSQTPCYSDDYFKDQVPTILDDEGGHKTVIVNVAAGTASVAIVCSVPQSAEAYLGTLTGANCDTTPANCIKEFDTQCDDLKLKIVSCTDCLVNAWIRNSVCW